MPRDLKEMTAERLRILIGNHERLGRTDEPQYIDAKDELDKRLSQGLNFQTSLRIISSAAREGRFLSYKDLADASGVEWGKAHYAIGDHLWRLVDYAHLHGWPMLSAIVVNKPNVGTGRMEPDTLKGFISAAKVLGHDDIVDEEGFMRMQQRQVFAWAQARATDDVELGVKPNHDG